MHLAPNTGVAYGSVVEFQEYFCNAKVGNFDVILPFEQDVLRFEVPVVKENDKCEKGISREEDLCITLFLCM